MAGLSDLATGRAGPARADRDVERFAVKGACLVALAAGIVRVPLLTRPLSPDEGGYLLAASQWSPGRSVYGAYFVDRPPLLIAIFALADRAGGAVPLRMLGIAAVVLSILIAGRLGGTIAAVLCAALLSTPLFDALEINGELLSVPFVLGAFLFLVRALRARSDLERYASASVAGALSAAATLVKQNMIDAFVVAAVLFIGLAVRGYWRSALLRAAAFAGGALGTVIITLGYAAHRGTGPGALWDALVTFRVEAAEVIHASAPIATSERLLVLIGLAIVAGVPMVITGATVGVPRPTPEPLLLRGAIAAVAWESAGALLGASYWSHYLIAFVPGLVLLISISRGRWARLAVGYAATCAALAFAIGIAHPPQLMTDTAVASYIRQHSRASDTMVVAFGHPDIVEASGLQSPYPYLWSLGAQVRDSHLVELGQLLQAGTGPRWVVVNGDSLSTWGIHATATQRVLDAHYRQVTAAGAWHVFERRGTTMTS